MSPALGLVLGMALGLAACGPADGPRPPRYAVAARPAWTRAPGAPALSRTWDFEDPADAGVWTSPDRSDGRPGRMVLEGRALLSLTGPHGLTVNPEIHHWLTLRMRSTRVESLTVGWRQAGETFDSSRRTSPMSVTSDGNVHTYMVRLADLRGTEPGAIHAEDGVDAFLLRFIGRGKIRVTLEQVALLSDYDRDDAGDGRHVQHRLEHRGVARRGVAAPVPGTISTTLDAPRPGDRLRVGLALVGERAEGREDEAVSVRIADASGRLSQDVPCTPGAPWTEVDLDLTGIAGSAGGDVTLHVSCDRDSGADGLLLLVGGALHLRPSATPLPDVIVYVEDTLRADRLGTYGYGRATDPHLQRIADQGVVLERVFAASSWTRPSMSSLLTSLDPIAHGNQTRFRRVPASLTLLPEVMADAGYVCTGFVTNFHAADWAGLDQGFDVYHGPRADGAYQLDSTLTSAVIHGPLSDRLRRDHDVQTFVLAHSFDPHDPYQPPPEDLATLTGADDGSPDDGLLYDAEILHNDRQLAALDAVLEEQDRQDDTLFMFTSDHGEAFGEHGHTTHRRSLHQEEVAIPWIVRWPAELPAGRRLEAPASHVDLAPTLLGLVGLPVPDAWRGDDLSARLRGEKGGPSDDRPLFLDVVYMEDDAPAHPHEVAVVVYPYKLVARVDGGEVVPHALYDLDEDPGERDDLLGTPAVARVVAGLLDAARAAVAAEPARDDDGGTAETMDPEMRAWMLEMGYLK